VLRVNHRGKVLEIAAEQDGSKPAEISYHLGRGWHGRFLTDFGGAQYRSRWNGDTLVIEKRATYVGNYGDMRGYLRQEWCLSAGGDVLTITTRKDGLVTAEVFRRK
jgi:hypothetical protein